MTNDISGLSEAVSGHSIIYFGPGKWEGMWRNRHHLMSRFARTNKVMYVEPFMYFKSLINHFRPVNKSTIEFVGSFFDKRIQPVSDHLYVYHSPNFVPIMGRYPLNRMSWRVWKSLLKNALSRLGFHRPIIWLSLPHMSHFIGGFNEKLSVYHVVDEYSAYGTVDPKAQAHIKAAEQQLLKSVDLAIVVSQKLYASKSIHNPHTYLVPNGVDYAAYDQALSDNSPPPSDISRVPRPVIGYSGLVSQRLDLELISRIATMRPEWSFVLMGEVNESGCEAELSGLRQLKNVYLLGNKPIGRVPYYVKAFDVCMVPYKLNEQTDNLSPLKLYDFLSMGKGIVTTAFPLSKQFKDVLHIAHSTESFVAGIEKALEDSDTGLFTKRRNIAAQNTWEDRVVEISGIINTHLDHQSLQ